MESIADRRADLVTDQECGTQNSADEMHRKSDNKILGAPVEYTRTLEKAYRFYKDWHVQKVEVSPNAQAK